ncbi:MAG: hypothetical protein RBT80_11265 [Candidatus Vecturithrix sp.]|jgi:hypothetical protein|nr:hypothetical protein [Candidatus Vecturithrix sp.]
MNKVYIYWLITVSIVVVIAGIIFAFIAPYFIQSIQDIFYYSFNDQSLQSINVIDKNHINWIYGVLGGTLAGWGMMILFMSISLLKENNKAIWNTILISVITWFVIDIIITVKYMVIPNIVVNIAILIAVIIPYIGNSKKSKKT